MRSYRNDARFAGVALLMGWSGVFIFPFISVLEGDRFMHNVAASGNSLAWGALLTMLMVFSCSGIAVFLYPRLKRENQALALWAVVLRISEAILLLVGATILLVIRDLALEAAKAGPETVAILHVIGAALRTTREFLGNIAGTVAFALGALIYNSLMLRGRLIPTWISAWGIAGASLSLSFCVLSALGLSFAISFVVHLLSGLQELALALYLILKGFRETRTAGTEPDTDGGI